MLLLIRVNLSGRERLRLKDYLADLAQGKIDAHFHDIGLQKVKSTTFMHSMSSSMTPKTAERTFSSQKKLVSLAVLASVLLAIGGHIWSNRI